MRTAERAGLQFGEFGALSFLERRMRDGSEARFEARARNAGA
jgi:hypothetical protein